jgi:hypothetical protein
MQRRNSGSGSGPRPGHSRSSPDNGREIVRASDGACPPACRANRSATAPSTPLQRKDLPVVRRGNGARSGFMHELRL